MTVRTKNKRDLKQLLSLTPEIALQRLRTSNEDTQDADVQPLPTRKLHLMSDDNRGIPAGTSNDWDLQQ